MIGADPLFAGRYEILGALPSHHAVAAVHGNRLHNGGAHTGRNRASLSGMGEICRSGHWSTRATCRKLIAEAAAASTMPTLYGYRASKGEHVGIARIGVPFGKELPSSENSCIAHALAYGHVLTALSVEGPHVMD